MWKKWSDIGIQKIAKYIKSEDLHTIEGPKRLPHGIGVLKYSVLPWAQTN